MESETSIPEDASATSLPFVESIMRTESEEIKFPQKNGNDQNFKHLLTEETRPADRGNTGEVSEPRQQEIYQESSKACTESEKKAEHQPEGYSIENKILRHTDSEELVMMGIIPKSSVSEDESEEILPSTASVSDEVVEKSIQQEIHDKEEFRMTNVNEGQKPEIHLDEKKEVPEVFGLQESAYQNSDEKELKAEPQLEAQNKEIIYTNQPNLEGDEPDKINRCNDTDEEKVPISHSGEKIVPEDDGKIKQEEATEIEEPTKMQILKTESESVPEDEAQETLPSTASVSDETVEKSIHQEIQDEGELAETNTNEGQKPEIHLDDKKKVPEESTYQTSEENEMKAEPKLEAQNQETTFTMMPKFQGNATKTNYKSNDTEENKVPDSHSREKFIPEDEGKFKQEEVTETEEATKKQILKIESESVPKDEAQDTLPSTASVSDETVETSSHEEIHGEKEIEDTNTNEDQLNEIDLDEKKDIFQVSCQQESTYKTSEEKKLKAESKLEVQNQETIQTNQPNSEGNAPDTINQSNDIDEDKVPVSHSGEYIEPEDEGRFKQEEATETEDANEIESVPKDEAKETLPHTASVSNETVGTSNHEEIHEEKELADTNKNEGQIHEIDLDDKKEVSEELAYQTSEEKELKAEPQLEVQNQETILTNKENLEGNAPETTNQSNDIAYQNNPVSHSGENIEPEDDGKFKQEEATETEDATKIESVPKDEAKETLPRNDSVCQETVETSNREEIHDEKEIADTNTNEGQKHEIDIDEKKEVSEESAYQTSEEKELKAEPQLEVQNQETILTNHANSEGNAPETIHQSTDNNLVSHSGENIEPKDEGKFKQDEATETEDATKIESVPKDEAKETLPRTASVSQETVETSNHEEIYDEKEIAETNTNEGQKHEIDIDEKKEVPEESAYQTSEEKELKAEPQLEVQNQETILINQENSEGNAPETINQTNDIEDENAPVSHSGENMEPEDDGKFKQEKTTETEDTSVPKDEAKETLSRTATVSQETVETSNHEEIHDEKEIADTNTNEGQKHEINIDEKKEEPEESAYQTSEEKEFKAEPQLEVQNQETILTNQENSEGNATETINQSNNIEDENAPVSHSGENMEPEDDGKFKQEKAIETEDATKIESVPKDEAKEKLPRTASVSQETIETSNLEEIHDEKEIADTNTNEGQIHEIDLDEKKEVSEESAYQTCEEKELKAEPQLEVQIQETNLTNQENSEGNAPETIIQSNDIEDENAPDSHNGENMEPEDDGKLKQEEATETEDATKIESVPKDEAKEKLPRTASVSQETIETSNLEEIHDEKEIADTNTNEGQIHEIDLDEKKEVSEESAYQTCEEKELKAEPQLEVQIQETNLTNQENSEGNAPETIIQSNDIEDENAPDSHNGENMEPEDDGKLKQEEATETEDANKIESVPKDEAKETLPRTASVSQETIETSNLEEIHDEKEIADTNTNEGQIHEIDLDDKKEVSEESAYQTCEEKELKAEPQLKVQIQETIPTNQENSEGNSPETIIQSNDIEDENAPDSHNGENMEPEDDGKFKQEKAIETEDATKIESVPKDEAKETLPRTASVSQETIETSNLEEIHDEKEIVDTNTNEGQIHEIDLDEKKEVSEESAYQTSEEKELKAEPQLEVQIQETILTNQENSEGNAPETINQSNDIEDENAPDSHNGENMEPEDDGKFKQEKAIETEDATKIESVPEDEAKVTLPRTASVSQETVETSNHEEIHDEKEIAHTNTNEGQIDEIDLDEKKEVSEESAYQISEEKELKAEPQLEVQNQETILTNQENSERNTAETINQSNDIEDGNAPVSHSGENMEPEDDGKFKQEEATETEDATKIESVPKDEAEETLPRTAFDSNETVVTKNHEEIVDDMELADTNTNEGQIHEIDLDEKKEVSEVFGQQESAYQTSEEKELKGEPQLEVQNEETILTNQENSEGNPPETINQSNDINEENVPVSHNGENIEPEDDGKFKHEEPTETEDATKIESVSKDEAKETLPRTASDSNETVGTRYHEDIVDEKELADTNTNEGQIHEIDVDEKKEVSDVFGQQESEYQTNEQKELKVEPQLEVQNQETIRTNQENSEGNAPETTNQSNDIEEENVPVSHSGENTEPEDDGRFKQEEATETEDATKIESVPKDEAKKTLPSTASDSNESVGTRNHEEIVDEKELADTNTNEGQIHEIDLDEKRDVSEVFGQQELAYQTNEQKELKVEPQLEVQNQETIRTNQENSEGNAPETTNQSNDIEEENVPVSHSGENTEPEDNGKFKQEEATETEDATKIESVPKDEAKKTLPSTASDSNESVGTRNHEEIVDEKELSDTNTNEGQIHEIDLDEKRDVSEVFGQQESACQTNEEKELKAEPQLEVQNQETILTKQENSEGNAPETINQSNDIEEENVPVSHSGENIEPEDNGKFKQEEATETEDATKIESVPKDEAMPHTSSVSNETVETSNHEEIHDEKDLADTNTSEGQIHEIDLDEKKEVSEVFGQQESPYQTSEEKELKADPQLEVQNQETILANQANSEGNASEKISQSNDIEEENVPVSHSTENIEPEDEGRFKQEEATETEDTTKIESVPKDVAQDTLPSIASVSDGTVETSKHEVIHYEEELPSTITNEGQIHETDLDEKTVVFEVNGQQESAYETSEENEMNTEPKLEIQNQETIPTNQQNPEGNAPEITNQSNDIEEENIPVSHSGEKIEPEDEGRFKQEEAIETEDATKIESVPKDDAQDTFPSTASVSDETVETSNREEIHDEEELADTNTNEGQIHEIDLDEKKELSEVFVQQESAYQTSEEKELKAEPQLDVQNPETIQTNQPNLEGNAPDTINQSNDIEEENVPVSHSGANIVPENEGKFKQEEATETEDATKMQKDEDQETLHRTASVSDEAVEKSIHQEIHDEEELAETNANEGKKHEIHLNEKREVPQESTYPTSEENELKAEPQSKAQNQETTFTMQPNFEGNVTDTKNKRNDTEEEKDPVSHSREKLVPEDEGKFKQEEATETEEAEKKQILITNSESVPKNEAQDTLPSTASVSVETVETSNHEKVHDEQELADTNNNEAQKHEIDLDEKKEVSEVFGQQELAYQTSEEKELKAEPQLEVHNQETIQTNQLNLQGNTPETINQSNNIEEERVSVSYSRENVVTEDEGKFKPEEATIMLKTESESVKEDEVQKTLLSTALVHDEAVEKSIHQEIHDEKELAETNAYDGQKPEIQLDEKQKVPEESTYQISEENELKAAPQLEDENQETIFTKQSNLEGKATDILNHQSNETKEEKVPVSQSREILVPEDEEKFKQEEETEIEAAITMQILKTESESVLEDEAKETLPYTASVTDEAIEKSIHQELHDEEELVETNAKVGQKHEIHLDENKDVPEESTYQNSEENELKAPPQSEAQNQETILTNQPNLEAKATDIKNQSKDSEEQNIPVSQSREILVPEDEGKFKQEEAMEIEEATKLQFLKTESESVPEDEAQETLPTTASVSDEVVEKSIHQEIHDEEELVETNANEGQKHEIHLNENKGVPEESTYKISEENELKAAPQSEAQNQETILTNQSNLEGKAVDIINQSNDTEEEKVPVSQSREILVPEDEGKFKQEEATEIEEATKMQILKTESESVPDNKAFSTLSTIASARDEPFEKSIQVEIHEETEFAIIHTREGQRPENELEENVKVLEAFDPHTVIGYTCPENEKKAADQTEAQRMETMIIKHLNLEGMETAEISPINDTKELEKEHKVAKPEGVSELLSVDITRECSSEEISNLSMLSDQNTNNSTFDVNKISAHDYCKLDSEKEQKMFIAACGCTATSTHKNSESIEGQQDSEKTSEDNLTGVAKERVTTELETEKSSHEQKPTDDTAAEKIVKAADTNGNLKLAPDSIDIEKSDQKNSVDVTMYKADGTSTDDEKGEKVGNSLISNVAEKVAEKLDLDSQSGVHESTEMDKSELLVEKIPEPPYPCKKLESYVDSVAHNQTNDKHSQTKEKSNNILDQISESDGHIQGRNIQCEHQIKPKPQMEGKHHFTIPLNAKPFSMASLITEVHDGVERAGGSENIEEQTIDSEKSLSEVQILFPREETVNQVKDHDINNYKATESEQRVITDLSSGNDPIKTETTSRDPDEVVEQAPTGKLETQEAEITQEGSAKEEEGDEFENISPSSSGGAAMIKGSRDTDMKASHKKSHGILSGVGSKVKHSISKVKKAITGKSSHPKTPSPK